MNPFISLFRTGLVLVTLGIVAEARSASEENDSSSESRMSQARPQGVSPYFCSSTSASSNSMPWADKWKRKAQVEEKGEAADLNEAPSPKKVGVDKGKGPAKRKVLEEEASASQPERKKVTETTRSSWNHLLLVGKIMEILEEHSYPDAETLAEQLIENPLCLEKMSLEPALKKSLKEALSDEEEEEEEDSYTSSEEESDESEETSSFIDSEEEKGLSDFSALNPAPAKRKASQLRSEIFEIMDEMGEEGNAKLTIDDWIKKLKQKGLTEDEAKDRGVRLSIRSFVNLREGLMVESHSKRVTDKIAGKIEEIRAELKKEGILQLSLAEWKERLEDEKVINMEELESKMESKTFLTALSNFLRYRGLLAVNKGFRESGRVNPKIREKIEAIKSSLPADKPQLSLAEWKERLEDEKVINMEELESKMESKTFLIALRKFLRHRDLLAVNKGFRESGRVNPKIREKIEAIKGKLPAGKAKLSLAEWKERLSDEAKDPQLWDSLINFLYKRRLVLRERVFSKKPKPGLDPDLYRKTEDLASGMDKESRESIALADSAKKLVDEQFITKREANSHIFKGRLRKFLHNKNILSVKLSPALAKTIEEIAPAVFRDYMHRPSFQTWLKYLREEKHIGDYHDKDKLFKALLSEFLHDKKIVLLKLKPDLCKQIEDLSSKLGAKDINLQGIRKWILTLQEKGLIGEEEVADLEFSQHVQEFLEFLKNKKYLTELRANQEGLSVEGEQPGQ